MTQNSATVTLNDVERALQQFEQARINMLAKLGGLESTIRLVESRLLAESGGMVELLSRVHYVQESDKGGFYVHASLNQLNAAECHEDCAMYFIIDPNGIALHIDGNTDDESQYSHDVVQALAENVLANDGLPSMHSLKIEATILLAEPKMQRKGPYPF